MEHHAYLKESIAIEAGEYFLSSGTGKSDRDIGGITDRSKPFCVEQSFELVDQSRQSYPASCKMFLCMRRR